MPSSGVHRSWCTRRVQQSSEWLSTGTEAGEAAWELAIAVSANTLLEQSISTLARVHSTLEGPWGLVGGIGANYCTPYTTGELESCHEQLSIVWLLVPVALPWYQWSKSSCSVTCVAHKFRSSRGFGTRGWYEGGCLIVKDPTLSLGNRA